MKKRVSAIGSKRKLRQEKKTEPKFCVFLKGKEKRKQKHNKAGSLFTESEIVDLMKIVYL
jgi:hypothetical protein